jgi:hypothetical protein
MFSRRDVRWVLTNLNYFETTSPGQSSREAARRARRLSAAQLRLQNTRRRLTVGLRGSARPHSRQAEGTVSTTGTLGEPVRSGSKGASGWRRGTAGPHRNTCFGGSPSPAMRPAGLVRFPALWPPANCSWAPNYCHSGVSGGSSDFGPLCLPGAGCGWMNIDETAAAVE